MSIDSTVSRRMTMAPNFSVQKRFVPVFLPWLVMGVALVVYLVTLNHWISLGGLSTVAKVSGWTWQPDVSGPLYWLVTLPLRWLPTRMVPLGLNLLSAVMAAATLALLTRSVALLPHDRTEEQRLREKSSFALLSIRLAWLPPVFAALLCGLQLTFWENAVMASHAMLNLLLLAYIIRCVLEFRIDARDSWLTRASLVFGAAMTDDWGMIGFFPLFLAVLIWIKGLGFFDLRFLTRMFFWGVTGVAFYLLLPLITALSATSSVGFWPALKFNLVEQKNFLLTLVFSKQILFQGDRPLWVLALPSLVPLLVLGIRWPSYFGDPSKLGVALATVTFHMVHGALLLVCTWVALDPQFSPRLYQPNLANYGILFLPFYYLGALSVGYFSGYFLLVFGTKPVFRQPRPQSWPMRLASPVVVTLVWVVFLLTPAFLLYRNFTRVRSGHEPALRTYAALLTRNLPPKGAVLLSDDSRRLIIAQSSLAQAGRERDYLFVDSSSLTWPDYHRYLHRAYGSRWPLDPAKEQRATFEPIALMHVLRKVAESEPMYYLHPSFGYYFEVFYQQPHGLVYELRQFPTNSLLAPLPDPAQVAENNSFWDESWKTSLAPMAKRLAAPGAASSSFAAADWLSRRLKLANDSSRDDVTLGSYYSRSLDYWGVALQASGRLKEAQVQFGRAMDLFPENRAAQANLECNRNLQAGRRIPTLDLQAMEEQFGKYRSWDQIVGDNGPFDEPNFCYPQGLIAAKAGLYRQAAQNFTRVTVLDPENLSARLWLAHLYVSTQMPERAIKVLAEIRADPALYARAQTNRAPLMAVEACAYLANAEPERAADLVNSVLAKSPDDEDLLTTAAQVFMDYRHYSNALVFISRQLRIRPDNVSALINQGYGALQTGAYDLAINALTKVIDTSTNIVPMSAHFSAMQNRAIAYLKSDQLDAARRDYEALQTVFPKAYPVDFGLQEVAYRKKDTNAAIRYCQLYLAHAPTNTTEARSVLERLKALQGAKP